MSQNQSKGFGVSTETHVARGSHHVQTTVDCIFTQCPCYVHAGHHRAVYLSKEVGTGSVSGLGSQDYMCIFVSGNAPGIAIH